MGNRLQKIRNGLSAWKQRRQAFREERRRAKAPQYTECQNCHTPLKGPYCYVCGQAAKEPRRAVIGLVQDVFVETLAIDSKLMRSLGLLLSRPGGLARRYLDGHRMRFTPPFRLYLFTSVFYFLAIFWTINGSFLNDAVQVQDETAQQVAAEAEMTAEQDPAELRGESPPDASPAPPDEEDAQADAPDTDANTEAAEAEESDSTDEDDIPYSERLKETEYAWLAPYVEHFMDAYERAADDPRLFFSQTKENLPRFMLLAPLVYGLILSLLYIYRRRFFIFDHLVVSLYMHAALYSYLLIAILLDQLPVLSFFSWVPLVWGGLQPMLVFRQVYRSNKFSVVAKWIISSLLYWSAVLVIVTLGVSYSLYLS